MAIQHAKYTVPRQSLPEKLPRLLHGEEESELSPSVGETCREIFIRSFI